MPSRIRRGEIGTKISPIEWRATGPAVPPPVRPLYPPSAPAAAPADSGADVERLVAARLQQERQEARRQGEVAGRQQATAELDAAFERMARAVEAVAACKVRLRHEAERDVVALALAIARRILRRQLQVDEEALLGVVKAAFENVNLREVSSIRVHPQFVARMRGFLERLGSPAVIQVVGDGSLEPGGLLLTTDRGHLDASLDTQLDEIGRGLTDALALPGRTA